MLDNYFINIETPEDFTHHKYTYLTTMMISCLNLLYGILFFNNWKILYPEIIYNIIGFLFYGFHYLGHIRIKKKIYNWWYIQHRKVHHIKHYPPSRFINRDIQRMYHIGDLLEIISYGGLVIIGLFCIKFIINITYLDFLKLCLFSSLHMFIIDYIHSMFHKTDICNINSTLFKHIYFLHYIHHKNNCKVNYCIIDFRFDLICTTYCNSSKIIYK